MLLKTSIKKSVEMTSTPIFLKKTKFQTQMQLPWFELVLKLEKNHTPHEKLQVLF